MRAPVVILQAARESVRNGDVLYAYRQDSDFLYLTGFNEPDATLVMCSDADGGRSILFCREKDERKEMWDGPMIGAGGCLQGYGMDEAHAIEELDRRLPRTVARPHSHFPRPGQGAGF